jgi:hypothetical protein
MFLVSSWVAQSLQAILFIGSLFFNIGQHSFMIGPSITFQEVIVAVNQHLSFGSKKVELNSSFKTVLYLTSTFCVRVK